MIVNTKKTYSCEACDGRGFTVLELYNLEKNRPLPNEVKDCEICNGTGVSLPIVNAVKMYTSTENAEKS